MCRSKIPAPSIFCRIPRLAAVTHLVANATDDELEGLHAQHAWQRSWVLLPGSRLQIPLLVGALQTPQRQSLDRSETDLVLSPATVVARGSVGLVRSGEPPRWLVSELVPSAELVAWEADKHAGGGRDRRLGAPTSIHAGSVMSLGDALASVREGPRATLEVLLWRRPWRCV